MRLGAKQFAHRGRDFAAFQIFQRAAEARQVFRGQIDAAHFEIGADIANNIRQLKGDAELLGEFGRGAIFETEYVQTGESNGAGYAVAVFAKAFERGVARLGEVHLRARN